MGDVELGLDTLNIFLLLFFGKKISSEREEEEHVVQRERAREREREGKGFSKRRERTCPRLLLLFLLLREVSKPLASA